MCSSCQENKALFTFKGKPAINFVSNILLTHEYKTEKVRCMISQNSSGDSTVRQPMLFSAELEFLSLKLGYCTPENWNTFHATWTVLKCFRVDVYDFPLWLPVCI
jgi:hypothetical protein